MPGMPSVAIESRKQAASRPESAIAQPGVRLLLDDFQRIELVLPAKLLQTGSSIRLVMLFASARPIRNSSER